jgi:hypothetical protein
MGNAVTFKIIGRERFKIKNYTNYSIFVKLTPDECTLDIKYLMPEVSPPGRHY